MQVNYTVEATNMIKEAGVESCVKDIIKDIGSRFENVERLSFEVDSERTLALFVFGTDLLLDKIKASASHHKKGIAKQNLDLYIGEGF